MAHTRVVKEHRIVLAGKGSLDGADSGLCNVFVVAGVMEQDGLGDLAGQFQMLVNAATVEADCGIRLTECGGAEGQLATQAEAQRRHLAVTSGRWRSRATAEATSAAAWAVSTCW
jgi:hypothetical protein